MLRLAAVALLALLIMLSPWPLGSNRPWSMALLQLAGAGLLTVTVLGLVLGSDKGRALRRIGFAAAGGLLVIGWAFVQTLPSPVGALGHPVWTMAAGALPNAGPPAIAVNPEQSAFEAWMFMVYASVFLAAYWIAQDTRDAHRLLTLITVTIVAYGLYGLLRGMIGWDHLFYPPAPDVRFSNMRTGPFTGHTYYAAYLGMGLVGLAVLTAKRVKATVWRETWNARLAQAIELTTSKLAPYLLAGVVLLSAISLTGSRGGFFAMLAGLLVVGTSYLAKQRGMRRWLIAGSAVVGGLLLTVISVEISGAYLAHRMDDIEAAAVGRWSIWQVAVQMIADAPLLGAGLGGFVDLFPLYTADAIERFRIIRVHNEYLELMVSLGVPMACLWFAVMARLGLICLGGVRRRKHDYDYPVAGIGAGVVIATASIADFPLEVPAVAITFAALLGIGCATAARPSGSGGTLMRKRVMTQTVA